MFSFTIISFSLVILTINISKCVELDPLGYILYCPCMGRFGNQADHFLGALGFARGVNRTLVLPPWVEYRYGEPRSYQVPFNTYFQVDPLMHYHKVITMEEFMSEIAPIEWPEDQRIAFCYTSRGTETESCNAKHGNPFGPFWDTFNVDFVSSEFYGPLHYDTHNTDMAQQWNVRYPPRKWPVLAFTGAPAAFPVQRENRVLHKHLKWSRNYEKLADEFIATLPKGAFIGVHLRNGIDWVRACEHIPESPNLFAAAQCLGYRNENGPATRDMCLPTKETILRQLKRTIKKFDGVTAVFVASDSNHLISDLSSGLQRMKVGVYKLKDSNPHVDLVVLGKANHFIGNCISSYSAFVKRERDAKGFTSSFWAFPAEKDRTRGNKLEQHDEL